MRSLIPFTLVVCLLVVGRVAAAEPSEQEAIAAAESWLKLVNAGQAGASWDAAASQFKAAVDKGKWEKVLRSARDPLGKLISRKLVARQLTQTLPGAPAGTYLVLQYQAQFEKKSVVETLTPMVDKDGRWRVSGYYLQ